MEKGLLKSVWAIAREVLGGLLVIAWVISVIISIGWISSLPLPAILVIIFCFAGLFFFTFSRSRSYEYDRALQAQVLDNYVQAFHQDFVKSSASFDTLHNYLADVRFHRDRVLESSSLLEPAGMKVFKEALEEYADIIEFMSDEIESLADYGFPIYGLFSDSPYNVKEQCLAFDKYIENDLNSYILELSSFLHESVILLSAMNSRLNSHR